MIAYLKKQDGKIFFIGSYMEVYIPSNLFKRNLNELLGDKAKIFGIFNFKLGNKNGEIDVKTKLQTFNLPSIMLTKPSSIDEKILNINGQEEKYKIFKYYTGDELLCSDKIIKETLNVERFINLLLSAHMPKSIKYEDVLKLFYKCMEINNETGNVPGLIYSIVVSELYRSKIDQSKPFRQVIGDINSKISQYDYEMLPVRNVAANNSTFNSLTFEDPNTMIAYSINRKRKNIKQNISPMEKIIHV